MAKKNQYYPQSVPHPGSVLEEKLGEMQMGPKEFAVRTSKPEKTITAILKGDSSITPDMAVLFENVTNIPARYWLNHQLGYDEYSARKKRLEMIENIVNWSKEFPLSSMIKMGWIEKKKTKEETAISLLSFFGVASPQAWEDYYCNQYLKVAFRISLKHTSMPFAVSAWLRQGELTAQKIETPSYSEKTFRESLPLLKSVMAAQAPDYFNQIQTICRLAGIRVVYTPCLPKAAISGATRWLNNTPLIQLSGRGKRNDKFWFSFFHEVGHILLHGKKEIFLEEVEYKDNDMEKEKEADEFAIKWTFSHEEEAKLKEKLPITEKGLYEYAESINTHPAIIIGRLQHKGDIPYSFGQKFFVPLDLSI